MDHKYSTYSSMLLVFDHKITNYFVFFPIVSESDCYVTLWLPTSSPEKIRTKTIANCKDPVWNETFYFRIQTLVKVGYIIVNG